MDHCFITIGLAKPHGAEEGNNSRFHTQGCSPTAQKPAILFSVTKEIFEKLPGLKVWLAYVDGLKNDQPNPEALQLWENAWQKVYSRCKGSPLTSTKELRAWRDIYKNVLGLSPKKFVCSAEALAKRAVKSEQSTFSVSPVVDLYNALSLCYLTPFGAFDLDDLPVRHDFQLRPTKDGDLFTALTHADEPAEAIPSGELAYCSGNVILTRHINWRQSLEALVRPSTTRVLFMAELAPTLLEDDPDLPSRIDNALRDAMLTCFEQPIVSTFFIDSANPSAVIAPPVHQQVFSAPAVVEEQNSVESGHQFPQAVEA